MASIFTVTAIVILISIFGNSERGHFLEYPNYHQSPGFHYWQNDKKELGGRVDKIARRHQIEAASRTGSSLLQEKLTNGRVEWQKQVKEGRSEVLDRKRNKELHIIRRQLLGKKLKLKNAQPKRTNDHLKIKPKINSVSSNILKRETSPINHEPLSIQPVKQQSESNLRLKRDVLINPQVQPEVFMQPHIQPPVQQEAERKSAHPGLSFHFYNPSIYYPEVIESLSNRTEPYQERIKEKRNKRQVVYLINKHPQKFLKIPRTTPNPFIREANIEEYDIVRPDPGLYKPEPDVTENKEADSSYMISETSDLEYESEYTISMSDSEDWENFPLTTPSSPNPAWHLSTLADIYQKSKRKKPLFFTHQKIYSRMWLEQATPSIVRMKRSPKQKKRKIGARKEKLKQRRKVKEMKRKTRIIKESKEDNAMTNVFEEESIENMLLKPKSYGRRNSYNVKEPSEEILWSNDTHRIVEDKGATFKWVNKTHYIIYKDNVTNKWYSKHHVLVYGDGNWENKTIEQKVENKYQDKVKEGYDENYSEDYDEEFTKEEEGERRQLINKNIKVTKDKQFGNNTIIEKKRKNVKKRDDVLDGNKHKKKGRSKDFKREKGRSKSDNKSEESDVSVVNDTLIDDGLGWEEQIEEDEESSGSTIN